MDIPDPISFLNRFGRKQRSVVQVMSRQSMPQNHVSIQNHKVPFSKQAIFNSFQNQSKHANFSLFFEINQNIPKSTSSLLNSHINTLPQFTKHHPTILTHFTQVAQTQTHLHIIYSSSCQISTTLFPINHHYT